MNTSQTKRQDILKIIAIIWLLMPLAVIFTFPVWLPEIGNFLMVKDNIQNADCIVPLGGYLYSRFPKAVELYNEGYSDKILFSLLPEPQGDLVDEGSLTLRIYGHKEFPRKESALMAFKYFGKGPENIYFTDRTVTSTYEEALATKDFMLKNGLRSLILVTSHYHARRALMLFEAVFKGTGIKIFNCTSGTDSINPVRWWRKESEVKMVLQEYLSMAHNFIYHFMMKKERTAFDSY
ncbi:MAG: YdcF family protein [Candidatus Omnitrophica bacterium]|nr:YdcF family protein [Candidatus Omnitrophota bacterium]